MHVSREGNAKHAKRYNKEGTGTALSSLRSSTAGSRLRRPPVVCRAWADISWARFCEGGAAKRLPYSVTLCGACRMKCDANLYAAHGKVTYAGPTGLGIILYLSYSSQIEADVFEIQFLPRCACWRSLSYAALSGLRCAHGGWTLVGAAKQRPLYLQTWVAHGTALSGLRSSTAFQQAEQHDSFAIFAC